MGLKINIGHKSGIILYINGEKIYSRNMPKYIKYSLYINSVEITSDTFADNAFDDKTYITLILPIELIKTNPNNIAIELHRLNTEEGKPQVSSMAAATLDQDSIYT